MSFYRGFAAFFFLVAACIQSLSTANEKLCHPSEYYAIWLKHESGAHKGQYTRLAVESGTFCYLKYETYYGLWQCFANPAEERPSEPRITISDSPPKLMYHRKSITRSKGITAITTDNDAEMSRGRFRRGTVYVKQGDHKVSIDLRTSAAFCPNKNALFSIQLFFQQDRSLFGFKDKPFSEKITIPSNPKMDLSVFEINKNEDNVWSINPFIIINNIYPNHRGLAILPTQTYGTFKVAKLHHPPAPATVAILIPADHHDSRWTFPLSKFRVHRGKASLETKKGVPFTAMAVAVE